MKPELDRQVCPSITIHSSCEIENEVLGLHREVLISLTGGLGIVFLAVALFFNSSGNNNRQPK